MSNIASKNIVSNFINIIIIIGIIYAIYIIMKDFRHENDRIRKEDNISKLLLSFSSIFTIISSTLGSGTVLKIAKIFYKEYKWLSILTFICGVFGFLFSAAALMTNENEFRNKVSWEQTDEVLKKKIIYNRISLGAFLAAGTIVVIMILLHWS